MTDKPIAQADAVKSRKSGVLKLWPFLIVLAGLTLAVSQGWHTKLSPQSLADNAVWLDAKVSENFLIVLVGYVLVYIAATTFMVPASALTIAGGFLFGLYVGAPATVLGATLGACSLFLISKSSIGEVMRERAGPFLSKMETGFKKDAISYLFSMRLIPVMPFAVANIAPALLGARFRDFALTTALGIIPGTIAYIWLGAAAKGTLLYAANSGEALNVGALFKSLAANFIPALMALGVVSLIPIIYKRFKKVPAGLKDLSE